MRELENIKGKRILGVNPPVFDFAYMDLWSKPLGLLFLLENLKKDNDVALLDCIAFASKGEKSYGRTKTVKTEIEKPEVYKNIPRKFYHYGLQKEQIINWLESYYGNGSPDYILVTSAMTYWYLGVKWIIELLKSLYPNAVIILGGIYSSLCYEHALTLGADFVDSQRGDPKASYPAFDLYDSPSYGVLMTSFGCPFSCKYCASKILWPGYHRRALDEVFEDFEFQKSLGIKDLAFYDDALLLDKDNYFYKLTERIAKESDIRMHTPNGLHVRQIDENCAHILYDRNFKTIRLSLESIDPKVAHDSSDKVARTEYSQAVKNLHKAGFSDKDCETYILVGLPGQNVKSVKDTIAFVKDCGGVPKLAEYSPIPGTSYFDEIAKTMPELRKEPLLQNNSVYCSYFSKDIDPYVLQELKDSCRLSPQ